MASAKYIPNFNSFGSSLPIGEDSTSIFSKIKNAGSKLNTTTYIIFACVILLTVLGGLYYYYYVSPQMKAKYTPNSVHDQQDSNKDAELLLFFADWCPHCKTAKPIWNDLKSEYQNKTINGYHIIFTEINCSEETTEVEKMMNQYNIEGFPTIKLLKDGQVIEYDAKPSKETLTQFLNTVL
jgi:thiol-disulfide isomerase/thioredoxin